MVWYLRKDRYYTRHGIRILVKKGVFHPGLFFSTEFLIRSLSHTELMGKTLLELGAGSGMISLYAHQKGAVVTATDINPAAIEGLRHNAGNKLNIILSDLFDNIPKQEFDYIIINPPFYPSDPLNDAERAWFCGKHFDYFEKLFGSILPFMKGNSEVWMSLSQDCDIHSIKEIANKNGLDMALKTRKRIWLEWNFIYQIGKKKQ